MSYKIPFVLDDTVAAGGYIRVNLPEGMSFSSQPNIYTNANDGAFFSTTPGIRGWQVEKEAISQAWAEAIAQSTVPGGVEYTLYVSGIRNPRSTQETENFNITTYDAASSMIGTGNVGNIKMAAAGILSTMEIIPSDTMNGATSDYEFKLPASVPIYDDDVVYFTFPASMDLPGIPVCSVIDGVSCPQDVSC